jgi:hypothetical protein
MPGNPYCAPQQSASWPGLWSAGQGVLRLSDDAIVCRGTPDTQWALLQSLPVDVFVAFMTAIPVRGGERDFFLTIKKWLKVGKHNALSHMSS